MNFDQISAVSLERAKIWHPGGLEDWSVSDWTVATAGEAGEVCNAIKKLKRVEQKISQKAGPQDLVTAQREVGTEVGDTYLYLDLLAQRIGSSAFKCVCKVPSGYSRIYEGASAQRLALHLMVVMASIATLALTADMETDVFERSGYLVAMEDHIGRAMELLSLIAQSAELTLQGCVVWTFNRVSEREGFPQRL